jgi:hypothetical protein
MVRVEQSAFDERAQVMSRRPVFIGGCPRSGTTLLRTMLNAHLEHAIPRETRFVLEAWRRRTLFGDLRKEANRRRLARWIFLGEKTQARRLGVDPEEAIARLTGAPPTLGSLLAECFVMFAEREGKPRWGDKRPLYALRIAAIFDLFPNAQFIHVVRDPRACVASARKLGWYEGDIVPSVQYWEATQHAVDAMRTRLGAKRLTDVRYEDLVREPEDTLRGVTGFLHSAADDDAIAAMLSYYDADEQLSRRVHPNLKRPLDTSRVSGWKESLSPDEIALIEAATTPLIDRWGYERTVGEAAPPAALAKRLRARRRKRGLARRQLAWLDRFQTHVTHRHPLGARGGRPAKL